MEPRPGLASLRRRDPPAPADAPLVAHDYEGFRALLNNRRMELRLSMLELDALAHFPGGYASKLLSSPREKHGHYQRNIGGDSMGKLLRALGIGIRLEQAQECGDLARDKNVVYPHMKLLRERARKGGRIAYERMNSMEGARFHKAGGLASAAARRAAAKKVKRKVKAPRGSIPRIAAE